MISIYFLSMVSGFQMRLVSCHPSQSPVARRPLLVAPCSNDGLAAVPARATSVPASGPQEYGVRVPGPLARLSRVTGLRPPSTRPGPRPARHPPSHHRVRPEPIPTQARASATGATSTGQQDLPASSCVQLFSRPRCQRHRGSSGTCRGRSQTGEHSQVSFFHFAP